MNKKPNELMVKATENITSEIQPVKITGEDIKNLFCPLATEKEVRIGLGIVKTLNLNPFTREVHFIKYSQNDKMAIVVGYEVYLKRAERTGKLNGWKAVVSADKTTATVTIWRKDWKEPFEWEVALSEFDKKQSTWKAIPTFMGKKVAIAQGFRLCFPDELGGLPYTEEEHQVYDVTGGDKKQSSKPAGVADPQAIEHVAEAETTDGPAAGGEAGQQQDAGAQTEQSAEEKSLADGEIVRKRKVLELKGSKVFKKKADFDNWIWENFSGTDVHTIPADKLDEAIKAVEKATPPAGAAK